MNYSHKAIEKKWQQKWKEDQVYKTTDNHSQKAYVLAMFPYPSGAGLHVGHIKNYTATDVFARFRRLQGYDVLHPIGWDAFGLPAEQYALQTGNDPRVFTLQNIDFFRSQLQRLGFAYDYEKEVNTANPAFYKITQEIFQEMYRLGLAELRDVEVNWCPNLGTVLANDEIKIVDHKMVSERGKHPVTKKKMRQWVLKITAYAEKLLQGLEKLDWPTSIKELQKNWIGKSQGWTINFPTENKDLKIPVFTTRADTIFGATYLVLAPENPLVARLTTPQQKAAVDAYLAATKQKSELDRKDDSKIKTGVFSGSEAINPFTKAKIPIWIADYVFNDYGSGAVMAVPAHDPRDWEFAKKFHLPIRFVLESKQQTKPFVGEAKICNSEFLNGLERDAALKVIGKKIIEQNLGQSQTHYKLRDWIFSRQRFYGEPFPIFYTPEGQIKLIDFEDLPVQLPAIDYLKPSPTGEPPLANALEWVNFDYHGQKGKRETNTMPQSAGSSWYYLAYLLTQSPNHLMPLKSPEAKKRFQKWMPVDLYVGGQEHAVGHLLYARFWSHVLYDLGLTTTPEPFQKLLNQGMILGPDGRKMSKSWGNTISPEAIINSHGADALRLYEMFMGPLEASLTWNYDGLDAARKWLDRVDRLVKQKNFSDQNDGQLTSIYNEVVQKVTKMVESLKLNTAISQLMVLLNAFYKIPPTQIYRPYLEGFLKMLSLFAPHLSAELWEQLGHSDHLVLTDWPTIEEVETTASKPKLLKMAVQVNGKLRGTIAVDPQTPKSEVLQMAKVNPNVAKFLVDKKIIKEIIVLGKVVNFVVQ